MKESESILKTYVIGVVFFLFIEAFSNLLVEINAYVFMNLSEILIYLPTLLITIILTVFLIVTFNKKTLMKHEYRLFTIIIIIAGLRLATQFIPWISVLLILNFLQLFLCILFFNEVIILSQKEGEFLNPNLFIAAIIFGLGIEFSFLIINMSSNLTTDFTKFIPIILISISMIGIDVKVFLPNNVRHNIEKENKDNNKKEVSYIHFAILGLLFLTCMIWILNPMALSAHGIINLMFSNSTMIFPWTSYGFTYYIFLILGTAFAAFYITTQFILNFDVKRIKLISIVLGAMFLFINGISLILIESTRTVWSTIFFSIATIINVGFVIYYSLYLFNVYSFNRRRKLFLGFITFIITVISFIILQVQVLWYQYVSLLINVIILVGISGVLVCLVEIKNFSILWHNRELNLKVNIKVMGIFFMSIFIINGVVLGVVIAQRIPEPQVDSSPTFMTWNIHNGIGVDDSFDLDRQIEQIKVQDPDVIALNEVDMGALKTSFIDIGTYFAHKLNMYYYYGYTFYKHYGNVLLSKYPIITKEILPLPLEVKSAEPRSMIRATIQIGSALWAVYVTHLSTEQQDRQAQVPYIVNKINEGAFLRVVWMGDFNLVPESGEYNSINSTTSLKFTDTYRALNSDLGYTGDFNDNLNPQKRIDYIMCSPDLNPTKSKVVCSLASDHCAVITEF